MEPQKSMVLPVVLAVLLSGVVFGGLGYYLTNKNNSTSTATITPINTAPTSTTITTQAIPSPLSTDANTLKTYTNARYAYTLKYPETWKVDESLPDQVSISEPHADNRTDSALYGQVQISVKEGDATHKYQDWSYDRYFNYLTTGGKSEKEEFEPISVNSNAKELTKIDDIDAYLVKYNVDISGLYGAFIKHGNDIYTVSLTSRNDNYQPMVSKYSSTLKTILSTFKFAK